MRRVSEMMGALLDFHVALAEGIPREHLSIQEVQRTGQRICVLKGVQVYDPSTSWMTGGAVLGRMLGKGYGIFKNLTDTAHIGEYVCYVQGLGKKPPAYGDTPLLSCCRALVQHAFGDHVPDVEVTYG